MRKLRIAVIGLGAVGSTLTPALANAGHDVVLLVGKGRKRERELARKVKAKLSTVLFEDIKNIDVIFVAIPTAKLAAYAIELSELHLPWRKLTFIHAAGPLGIAPFKPLAKRGAGVAAMHPYQTFPKRQRSVALRDIIYGITGNARGERMARQIARGLGGKPVRIREADRVLYHLSAVIACGFTAANLEIAGNILEQIGIDKRLRDSAVQTIAEETIRNVRELGTRAAMTGPAARGDVEGVRKHVRELKARMPELTDLYEAMSLRILEMRQPNERKRGNRSK